MVEEGGVGDPFGCYPGRVLGVSGNPIPQTLTETFNEYPPVESGLAERSPLEQVNQLIDQLPSLGRDIVVESAQKFRQALEVFHEMVLEASWDFLENANEPSKPWLLEGYDHSFENPQFSKDIISTFPYISYGVGSTHTKFSDNGVHGNVASMGPDNDCSRALTDRYDGTQCHVLRLCDQRDRCRRDDDCGHFIGEGCRRRYGFGWFIRWEDRKHGLKLCQGFREFGIFLGGHRVEDRDDQVHKRQNIFLIVILRSDFQQQIFPADLVRKQCQKLTVNDYAAIVNKACNNILRK